MVTIKDIAKALELAPSSVARALNNDPRISVSTREKVQAAAKEMGYVRHLGAAIMGGGRSNLLGLIIPNVDNRFYAVLAQAMSSCSEQGYQLLLSVTEDDPKRELEHLRALTSARAAGVVVVPTPKPLKESVSLLQSMPFVQLIRHVSTLKSDQFTMDDKHGVQVAVDHLVKLGHRRIAYVGVSDKISTGQTRLQGYVDALKAHSIELDPQLISLSATASDESPDSFAKLYEEQRPTAVVTGGTPACMGVLEAIHQLGISIPEDCSVVGFGDPPWYKWWHNGLTSIRLPVREIALSSVDFLIRRMQSGMPSTDREFVPQFVQHKPFLVERGSTAACTPRLTGRRGNR